MAPAALGSILLILAIWGLSNPFVGLLGLIAVNLVNPGELYPVFAAFHVERIFVLIVCLSTILHHKMTLPPISKRVLAFWLVMFASVPLAFYKAGALEKSFDFGETFLYHLLTINLVNTKERFRTYIVTMVGLIGWIASGTLWGYAHGNFNAAALRNGLERAQGLTSSNGDPNTLGITMVSALPLIGLVLFNGNAREKLLAIVTAVAAIIAVILTASRTSFALMLFLIGIFFLTRKRTLIYVPIGILLFAVIWTAVPDRFKDRYTSIGKSVSGEERDTSYGNRLTAWKAGWQMFLDYPLTGVGKGQFQNAAGSKYWPGDRKFWLQPHSLYVQLTAELGLLGIVAWGTFLVYLIRMNFALKKMMINDTETPGILRYFPTACLFCLMVLLVAGYAGHNLYRSTWYSLAALSGALAQISSLRRMPVEGDPAPENELSESVGAL